MGARMGGGVSGIKKIIKRWKTMDVPIKIQGRQHCATGLALPSLFLFSRFIINERILLAIKVSGQFCKSTARPRTNQLF